MSEILEVCKAEDFIEYFVYPANFITDDFNKFYNQLTAFIAPFIEEYIWNKDEFLLRKNTNDPTVLLSGISFFGENIDDEWYIVHILKRISENFDVLIRTIDSDGEFLLIEAADELPKWMKPENCEKRVYFYKGKIRILPLSISPEPFSSFNIISFFCREIPNNLENIITKTIDRRIEKFSSDLSNLLHKRLIMLPTKIAALLDAKPNLITAAVTAFCHHDIIDKKVYRRMKQFPPNDLVLRSVTFTKFVYAMLVHDKSQPDRSKWNLPPPLDKKYQEYLLGYKITCGFEILASKCCKKSQSDLTLSKKWNQYIQILKKKGYFKDLLENSKEYVELEKKARVYFLDNVGVETTNHNVLDILQTVTYDVNKMKEEESLQSISDDEKWLDINEEELNKLLKDYFRYKDLNVTNSDSSLSSVINGFLHRVSDVEGVEITNEKTSNKHSSNNMDIDEEQNNLSFNPDEFVSSVEKMLDIMELQNSNSGISQNGNDESNSEEYDSETESNAPEDPVTKQYMTLMDQELSNTTLAQSFVTNEKENIDIDENVLTNILKSYKEQYGGSGPAGNLIHSMGLKLDIGKSQ